MNNWEKIEEIKEVLENIKQRENDIDNIENDDRRLKARNEFNIDEEIQQIKNIVS